MPVRIPRTFVLSTCVTFAAVLPAAAQTPGDSIASWVALTAPPAWEHVAAPALSRALPGWTQDVNGNWIVQRGQGSPHRVVACSIDRPSYVVSQIRDDGWLRVQQAGRAPTYALWAQQHEGQRAQIVTRAGTRPAVFATPSTHLIRRNIEPVITTADELYVDVGATSASDVATLGIRMLDPVVRDWPAWSYNGGIAGPMAGTRAGCAAIASAAAGRVTTGRTTYIIASMGSFSNAGLGAALARLGPVDALTIVGPSSATAAVRRIAVAPFVPRSARLDSVTIVSPAVRWAGALAETISVASADSLRVAIARAAGVVTPTPWLMVPSPPAQHAISDSLSATASLLASLADEYGVAEHEQAIRSAVIARMPAWARSLTKIDGEGNIIVAFGPDRDTAVFLGHLDETGYEVQSIAGDGTVTLRARGGMQLSLWEGQLALLHFDAADGRPTRAPVRGIFVPRTTADAKQPRVLTAWFGADSAALAAQGVRVGQSVTSPKNATRIGANRFTARSLDDRAGSAAMLLALAQIDPSRVTRHTVFVWTVEEETGLVGAAAVAARFGTTVRVAYSIDTFVSSDSPLENARYAFAALGGGPVLRALDSSSSASPDDTDHMLGVARNAGIPLHANTTSGGTDGSTMLKFGAVQAGVSWPGRYSHSPVEVLDLRDLQQLGRLITRLALDQTGPRRP